MQTTLDSNMVSTFLQQPGHSYGTSSHLDLACSAPHLLWWEDLEGGGNLLLPAHLVLAKDLCANVELLAALWKETSAENDGVWTHD